LEWTLGKGLRIGIGGGLNFEFLDVNGFREVWGEFGFFLGSCEIFREIIERCFRFFFYDLG
jgi:hypothetical protein